MMFELIWSTTGKPPAEGRLTEVASTLDLDSAKRDLLKNIARKNILRCAELRAANPEYFLHLPLVLAGQSFHLLERGGVIVSGDSGAANSGHHKIWYSHQRLLSNTRAISAGPARVLRERSLWPPLPPDHPNTVSKKPVNVPPLAPLVAASWGKVAGDPGWAGLPLEAYKRQQPCRLKVANTLTADRVLDLLVESQSLLEAMVRWKIPLVYQAWLPAKYAGTAWLAAHSIRELATSANPSEDEFAIDLTQVLGEANNSFVENAREGNWVRWQQLHPESARNNETPVAAAAPATTEIEDAYDYRLGPISQLAPESTAQSRVKPRFLTRQKEREESQKKSGSPLGLKIALGSAVLLLLTILGFWLNRSGAAQNALIETTAQNKPANADSNPESSGETVKSKAPNRALDFLLSNLTQQLGSVSLPEKPTDDAVALLNMLEIREDVRQLEFGLALPKEFLNLSFFPGPENEDLVRNIKSNLGEGESANTEAEVRLRRIEMKQGEQTQLLWRWLSQPPSGAETIWKMGALVAGQKGSSAKLFLPLEAPQRKSSRTLLSLIREPLEIPASHPAVSKVASEEGKSPWLIDCFETVDLKSTATDDSEIKWIRSPVRLENEEYSYIPDRKQLELKILKRLKTKPYSRAERAVTDELQKYPNLGFCLNASMLADEATEDGEQTNLKIIPRIIIPLPQAVGEGRSGNVVPEKIKPELSDESLRDMLVNELKQLIAYDYELTKADIERLGDWLNSPTAITPDPEDCRLFTRYLIGEELEKAVSKAIESRLRLRVLRLTELQTKNGRQVFPIPAFVFE